MVHSIKNKFLEVQINETGAELMAITAADGTEYLWSGDKTYWGGHAPILFPYVGRLTDNRYTYCGKEYQMNRHGFARGSLVTAYHIVIRHLRLPRLALLPESQLVICKFFSHLQRNPKTGMCPKSKIHSLHTPG